MLSVHPLKSRWPAHLKLLAVLRGSPPSQQCALSCSHQALPPSKFGPVCLRGLPAALQVTPAVEAHLKEAGVTVKAYTAMLGDVKQAASAGQKLWVDPSKARPALAASLHFCAYVLRPAARLSLLGSSRGWTPAGWVLKWWRPLPVGICNYATSGVGLLSI